MSIARMAFPFYRTAIVVPVLVSFAILLKASAFIVLSPCPLQATEGHPDLSYLTSWQGICPSNFSSEATLNNPDGLSIFDDINVRAIITRDIPAPMANILMNRGWATASDGSNVEMPIEVRGHILLISACKPQFCGTSQINVFLDTVTAEAHAYWLDDNESQWIGPGQQVRDVEKMESMDPWTIYSTLAR